MYIPSPSSETKNSAIIAQTSARPAARQTPDRVLLKLAPVMASMMVSAAGAVDRA
jgi:hypothetical protein